MRHVDSHRQRFAEPRRIVRIETADDLALADLQHGMGLGPGGLDDLDRRGQLGERRLLRLQVLAVAKEMFGAHAERDLAAGRPRRGRLGERERRRLAFRKRDRDRRRVVELSQLAGNEIHRRRPHEAGDEHVGRALVNGLRLVELLDRALVHDRNARSERHGLDLVMRDIDGRLAHPLMQLLDFGAHVHAQLGVEIGEGLVEQKKLGVASARPIATR
jgi:hypothetical protein